MPYAASPAIPPGMDPGQWRRVVREAAKEAGRLTAILDAGGPVPRDVQARALAVRQVMGAMQGIGGDAALAADYLMGTRYGPQLSRSLEALNGALVDHAERTGDDMAGWLAQQGWQAVPNRGALHAVASRTGQAMLHDWERLTATTRNGVAAAIANGMAAGTNPRETARLVQAALLKSGDATYARGLLIARTEMADCYDASVMHTIRSVDGVIGYRYRAQPDACPVCQVLHGLVFPADEYPDRHHMCRCVITPVLDDEGVAPGDYMPGQQRPRHLVESQVPKSWQPLPDDLRDMLAKQENPGWRQSWTLQKPGTGQPRLRRSTPGDPLPRSKMKNNDPSFKEYAADHSYRKADATDFAAKRRAIAQTEAYADGEASQLAHVLAQLEDTDPSSVLRPYLERDVRRHREALAAWRRDLAELRADLASMERYGYNVRTVKMLRAEWKANTGATWVNRDGVRIQIPNYGPTIGLSRAERGRIAQLIADDLYAALDVLPADMRARLNLAGVNIEVGEYGTTAAGGEALAWAFFGTETRPALGASFKHYVQGHQSIAGAPHANGWHPKATAKLPSEAVNTWVHELGHVLDTLSAEESRRLMDDAIALTGGDVAGRASQYATTNGRELVAEVFSMYVAGEDTPLVRLVANRLGWR